MLQIYIAFRMSFLFSYVHFLNHICVLNSSGNVWPSENPLLHFKCNYRKQIDKDLMTGRRGVMKTLQEFKPS